jgi:hypothetical protein
MLVLAPTAGAAAPQPGTADGVNAVTSHGKLVLVFTKSAKRTWKRVAGRQVAIDCVQTPSTTPGEGVKAGRSDAFKAPKTGMKLKTGIRAGAYDLCFVSVLRKSGDVSTLVDMPLTQKGAVFEDERLFASDLLGIVDAADSLAKSGQFPSGPALAAKYGGAVVVLGAPTDTPAAGKYGFYSDASQHITAVTLSSAGRRLFVDVSGDTVSTNVLPQINSLG